MRFGLLLPGALLLAACQSTPSFIDAVYTPVADWPNLPAQWRLGDVAGVSVDSNDQVWVLHRPGSAPADQAAMAAPPVMVFDTDGNFIKAWGGPGAGYEWPVNEHGLHVDSEGFVWVTGNACPELSPAFTGRPSDDQVLKFTGDGEFVMQVGRAGQNTGSSDQQNVHRSADAHVNVKDNEVYVADGYGNRRVIVFDATTGAYKRQWGYNGGAPGDRNPCISTFDTEFDADQFSIVHSLRVADDGTVFVADRENSRIQSFTPEGELIGEFIGNGGMIAALALPADPGQRILVASEEERGILFLDRDSLALLGEFSTLDLEGPNHLIAVDSTGNIYRASLFGGIIKLANRAE